MGENGAPAGVVAGTREPAERQRLLQLLVWPVVPDGAEGEASAAAEHPMLQEVAQRQKGSLHRIMHEMVQEDGDPVAGHPLGHLFQVEDIKR